MDMNLRIERTQAIMRHVEQASLPRAVCLYVAGCAARLACVCVAGLAAPGVSVCAVFMLITTPSAPRL